MSRASLDSHLIPRWIGVDLWKMTNSRCQTLPTPLSKQCLPGTRGHGCKPYSGVFDLCGPPRETVRIVAIYVLAATAWLTVIQRILYVRKQLLLLGGSPNGSEQR